MQFTVAERRAPAPASPQKRPPVSAPLGKVWRDYYTEDGKRVYGPVKAVTKDGEWLFLRFADGAWGTGHLPTETEVKDGLKSLAACRRYAGTGKAEADLARLQAAELAETAAGRGER